MSDYERAARDAWLSMDNGPAAPAALIARLATRVHRRAVWERASIIVVCAAAAAWGVFEIAQGPSLFAGVLAALPFLLVAVLGAREYSSYRIAAPDAGGHTGQFLLGELTRARDAELRLAGWRGFALLLGVMWLMVAGNIASDGPAVAFARRGSAEGIALAFMTPVAVAAVVFFFWRISLRRTAAARQLEIDHLGLIERAR